MLRWLWKMQSDRGGQHAEAGVLMATLILLGTAVTVGSVPQLSTAVADNWVCHISDPESSRCVGQGEDATSPQAPTGRSNLVVLNADGSPAFDADGGPVTGDSVVPGGASSAEPATSHYPPVERGGAGGGGGEWTVHGLGKQSMDYCDSTQEHCVTSTGQYLECDNDFLTSTSFVPKTCSIPIAQTPLSCTEEGLSPSFDLCTGPDGAIVRCTDGAPRYCTDTYHDADTSIPDGTRACNTLEIGSLVGGADLGGTLDPGTVCMGSNGTLYSCGSLLPDGSCSFDSRALPGGSSGLKDCQALTQSGVDTVQCTWSPAYCSQANVAGTRVPVGCAGGDVTVKCLVDSGGSYQHCHSLGQVVGADSTVTATCLDTEDPCADSVAIKTAPTPDDLVTTQVGELTVGVEPDTEVNLTLNGEPVQMTTAELTDFCDKEQARCDAILDSALARQAADVAQYFRDLGMCTDDCDAVVASFAAAGGPGGQNSGRGRNLAGTPGNGINLATSFFFLGSSATGYVNGFLDNPVLGHVSRTLGLVSATLFGVASLQADWREGENSYLRRGGASSRAVAIASIAGLASVSRSALAAARRAGLTAADWLGTAGNALYAASAAGPMWSTNAGAQPAAAVPSQQP